MPWHVVADHAECGEGKFAVVKDDGGEVVACHNTEESAGDQVAALYASEDDRSGGEDGEERLTAWDEGAHPRAPTGTTTGGQFAKGQGEKKPPPRKAAPKAAGRRPAAKKADGGTLAYDPATGRGPGYGMKGGDPRVRGLQEALNRLGLTDGKGKKLAVDGKLGPLTTQAIKAAQKKLGVEATGKVTPALLAQLTKAKAGAKRDRDIGGVCVRSFDFEFRGRNNNGRTLEGYVAVFGATARISDLRGDFDEEIHRGAFDRSLSRSLPVMQFDHGRDTRVGSVPIGVYDVFEPDNHGYYVRGELFDNPVVEPVRQAIEGRAIRGMSWKMLVGEKGQKWTRRHGDVDKRDILDADVPESGPVVFPAYDATSVSVRSLLAAMDPDEIRALVAELHQHLGAAVDLDTRAETIDYYMREGLDPEETAEAIRAGRSPWTGEPTTDLTGRSASGDAGGGDPDSPTDSGERSMPPDPRTRDRVLRAYGVLTNA